MNRFIRKYAKSANPYADIFLADSGSVAGRLATHILNEGPVGVAGDLAGYLYPADKLANKGRHDFEDTTFIPGALRARAIMRDRMVDKEVSGGKKERGAILTELAGQISLPVLLGVAGYLAGKEGIVGNGDSASRFKGAAAGAGIGLGASLLAWIAGLSRKRRTKKEHKEYLRNNPELKNLLIPLHAAYADGRRDRMKVESVLED